MFKLKVLSKKDTEQVLNIGEVIKVVEDVYQQKAAGKTEVFPLVFHEFEPGVADMDIKSGHLKGSGIFGLKLVSWYLENKQKDLPQLIGTIMVFDDQTGAPIGILDGSHITGMRTGAAGAIGAKLLARKDAKNLLIIGAGHIATFQVAATLALISSIESVSIYDALDYENSVNFANNIKNKLKDNFKIEVKDKVEFKAVDDLALSTHQADIIITVTPAKQPIIKKEWVKAGTHFSCMGADMSGKEEIDAEIMRGAKIFVDDLTQCINVGEIEIPLKQGIINQDDIQGEIGDILLGKVKGRESAEEITIFDATGTALLDLITAKLAFKEADEQNIGQTINL